MIPNRPDTIKHPDLYADAERLSNKTESVTHRANHILSIYNRLVERRTNPDLNNDASWTLGTGYTVGKDYRGSKWPTFLLPDLAPTAALQAITNCDECTSNGLMEVETGWIPCRHE